jgi:hypothetical protein
VLWHRSGVDPNSFLGLRAFLGLVRKGVGRTSRGAAGVADNSPHASFDISGHRPTIKMSRAYAKWKRAFWIEMEPEDPTPINEK